MSASVHISYECASSLCDERIGFRSCGAGDTEQNRSCSVYCGWCGVECKARYRARASNCGRQLSCRRYRRADGVLAVAFRQAPRQPYDRWLARRSDTARAGGLCHHRLLAAWSSAHLRCVRYVGVEPLLKKAGGGAMCFEMGGVVHELVGRTAPRHQFGQDAVEHSQTAPTNEPVIDGPVRDLGCWCIPPAQPIADLT